MGWEGRSQRSSKKAEKKPEPLTRQKLEQLALAYVNRFVCTATKLTQHLTQRVRKLGAAGDEDAGRWIAELVERYLGSGVLNDARFAQNLASQLTSRGKSARAISQKLTLRGVSQQLSTELMTARREAEPGAELEAARTYVRKRRLGPFRDPEQRAAHRQKDLASLARQGFSFDVARQALGPARSGDDEEF
jgi:regulatory protein